MNREIEKTDNIFQFITNPRLPSNQSLIIIMSSFIFFNFAFMFINKYITINATCPIRRKDSIYRILHILYSVIVSSIGIYNLFILNVKCGYYNSTIGSVFAPFGLGFYLYDLILLYKIKKLEKANLLHHLSGMICLVESILLDSGEYLLSLWAFYFEFSNFPCYMRFIYQNQDKVYTKIYLLYELIYVVLFFILRFLYVILSTDYIFFSQCENNLFISIIAHWLLILYISILVFRILSLVKRRIREYKERCKWNIDLYWFVVNEKVNELIEFKHEKKKNK